MDSLLPSQASPLLPPLIPPCCSPGLLGIFLRSPEKAFLPQLVVLSGDSCSRRDRPGVSGLAWGSSGFQVGGGWSDHGRPTRLSGALCGLSGALCGRDCDWGFVQGLELVPYGKLLWGGLLSLKVETGLCFRAQKEPVLLLRASILGWTSQSSPQKASKVSVGLQKPNPEPLRLVFSFSIWWVGWGTPSKNNSPFPLPAHLAVSARLW